MRKLLIFLFATAFILRVYSFLPDKIILGYDQIRDLFTARSIWYEKDLKIIGPTAGNNTNLHHGVFFWYYLIPPIVMGRGNPVWVSIWNSIFGSIAVIVIYLFAKSLFKNNLAAFVSGFIASVSSYFIAFSGWIGNPSPTLLTVPLFFFFLWKFINNKSVFLIPAFFILGLSIQLELFFIYLIPVTLIIIFTFRPKKPVLKILFLSLFAFLIACSTMIATEIKYGFSGVSDLVKSSISGELQGQGFVNNLKFMFDGYGDIFFRKIVVIIVLIFLSLKFREKPYLFLIIYLLSPLIMLFVGIHRAPWFLIGLAPAAAIAIGYLVSQFKNDILIIVSCILIFVVNFNKDTNLLDADKSSYLTKQLDVIDYTYQQSHGDPFIINSVTNPLYINYIWAYNYPWYGLKKYGYLPSWLGGDQIHPYDTLSNPTGREKLLFLLIDETPRIPEVHKDLAVDWANKQSKLIEEKSFDGILVQKREMLK